MSLIDNLVSTVGDLTDKQYQTKKIDFLPSPDNIGAGNKAYILDICAFYVDLRGADTTNFDLWLKSSGKNQKVMVETVLKVIKEYEGTILNIQGNGLLAVWKTSKSNINKAVEASLAINWFLKSRFDKLDKDYLSFGIGIHSSNAIVFKSTTTTEEYDEEVIYNSPAINLAIAMGNQLKNKIAISAEVYQKLYTESKEVKKSFILIPYKRDIWKDAKITWSEHQYPIKTTVNYWNVETQKMESP
ncbi:MAG: hypothetical protein ACW99A_22135 [Candidatus Kariarchaeaceae archaeon]|jgi:class 3 adenylate cyclase